MHKSLWHYTLVIFAAVSLLSISTGCRSGGWSMPGSSWVSWGKKKPPTSSIAGTRDLTQPPSISVPPYPPNDSSSSSATSTAMASYPSAASRGEIPSGYGASTPAPESAVQPVAAAAGYATGPYNTAGGDANDPQAQQGFYRPSSLPSGGPVASTADARGGYVPPPAASYGTSAPSSGYPSPTPYDGMSLSPDAAPTAGNYAPVTTPNPTYGAPEYGTADAGYPASESTGGYPTAGPTTAYPSTPFSGGYPAAGSNPGLPANTAGSYGSTPTSPPTYGATPYPIAPSTYGDASTYGAPSQYGTFGASQPAATSGTDSPSGAASSTYGTSGGYRPGSTSRNNNLLNTNSVTPNSGTAYPSTYNR